MHILKIIFATFGAIIFLFIVTLFVLFARIPYRISNLFNKITMEEATQLVKECKIKSEGLAHIGDINLTLADGSNKFLDKKYWGQDNELYQLTNTSGSRCGFQIPVSIE